MQEPAPPNDGDRAYVQLAGSAAKLLCSWDASVGRWRSYLPPMGSYMPPEQIVVVEPVPA